jgi:membrane protein
MIYLSNFADYGVIYGSLGTAIALLVYLYLSAVASLLGEDSPVYAWPRWHRSLL